MTLLRTLGELSPEQVAAHVMGRGVGGSARSEQNAIRRLVRYGAGELVA